jgi:glycosyltransferase involved in cell wall biosynthesis
MGHRVEIASLDSPADIPADESLTIHGLGRGSLGGYGFTDRLVPWLKAERSRFDAVLVHGLWQYQGWGTHVALKGTGTPYLVFPHGMLDPWFRKAYPLKHYKKQVYWWLRERRVLADAASTCFTCEEERRLARESFWPYRLRERVVAYGTADPSGEHGAQLAAWSARAPDLSGRPFLLFLGRLHSKKGLELLIRAYASRARSGEASAALVIAGPGLDTEHGMAMRRLADRLSLAGTVFWPGMLEGAAKWGALRACEAFVLPSHQENFGIAVAEALACGKPVLITRKVNIWREINGDGAGLVCHDTESSVREMLGTWSSMDACSRERMGEAGRQCFLSRFEIRRAAESLVAAVKEATVI